MLSRSNFHRTCCCLRKASSARLINASDVQYEHQSPSCIGHTASDTLSAQIQAVDRTLVALHDALASMPAVTMHAHPAVERMHRDQYTSSYLLRLRASCNCASVSSASACLPCCRSSSALSCCCCSSSVCSRSSCCRQAYGVHLTPLNHS